MHHPGEIIRQDFLVPLRLSRADLAKQLQVTVGLIDRLLAGKASVDEALAWKLAMAFRTSPKYWENLQAAYDNSRKTSEAGSGLAGSDDKSVGPSGQHETAPGDRAGPQTI